MVKDPKELEDGANGGGDGVPASTLKKWFTTRKAQIILSAIVVIVIVLAIILTKTHLPK